MYVTPFELTDIAFDLSELDFPLPTLNNVPTVETLFLPTANSWSLVVFTFSPNAAEYFPFVCVDLPNALE